MAVESADKVVAAVIGSLGLGSLGDEHGRPKLLSVRVALKLSRLAADRASNSRNSTSTASFLAAYSGPLGVRNGT